MAGCVPSVSDADLVRSALGGDASAFERLASRYRPDIARVARGYLRLHDDAEDAVQETLARALENISSLERPELVGGWLMGIASNVCQETLRQRARLIFCGMQHDPLSPSWHAAVDCWQNDRGRTAMQALAGLPVQERSLLVLHCLEGAPLAETAGLLGISLCAAKMRVRRARQMAREVPCSETLPAPRLHCRLAHAYYYLGALYLGRGERQRLRHCWDRAIGHAPKTALRIWDTVKPAVYASHSSEWSAPPLQRGACSTRSALLGDVLQIALQALEAGLRRHPDAGKIWLTRGKILHFGAGDVDAGVSAFERAAESAGIRHLAFLNQAKGLALAGLGERALACMDRMEREGLWDPGVPVARAWAYRAAGQHEAAVREARRALNVADASPEPYWGAYSYFIPGTVLAALGCKDEARRAYLSALQTGTPLSARPTIEQALGCLAV